MPIANTCSIFTYMMLGAKCENRILGTKPKPFGSMGLHIYRFEYKQSKKYNPR